MEELVVKTTNYKLKRTVTEERHYKGVNLRERMIENVV